MIKKYNIFIYFKERKLVNDIILKYVVFMLKYIFKLKNIIFIYIVLFIKWGYYKKFLRWNNLLL